MSVNLYGVPYYPSSLIVFDNSGYGGGLFGFGDGQPVQAFEAMDPSSGNLIYAIAMTPNATSEDDYAWIYSNTVAAPCQAKRRIKLQALLTGLGRRTLNGVP